MSVSAPLEAAAARVLGELVRSRRLISDELGGLLGGEAPSWASVSELLVALGVNVAGAEAWLDADIEPLSERRLRETLSRSTRAWLRELHLPLLVDSTNTRIMARAQERGSIDGLVYLAEAQSAGRGRRGRQWYSPFGRNIALSLGVRLPLPAGDLAALSLAVGLAVIDTLLSSGVEELGLKWPNDLLLRQRKLGGILIELAGAGPEACEVVIGVGLNMAGSRALAPHVDQPVADLAETAPGLSRNALAARLIGAIHEYAGRYAESGFAPMREPWQQFNIHQGRVVRVHGGAQVLEGVMEGVDEHGALLLRRAGGLLPVTAGEVSLRAHDEGGEAHRG